MNETEWHVCRAFSPPDRFQGECGCRVAVCGFVIMDSNPECPQHALKATKTIRAAHGLDKCSADAARAAVGGQG